MARLPTPGGDSGNWGDILNNYLSQVHNSDGLLKDDVVSDSNINSISQSKVTGLSDALNSKADDNNVIHLNTDEIITGTKTFNAPPILPAPTGDNHPVTKSQLDKVAENGEYWNNTYENSYEFASYGGYINESSTFSGWAGAMGSPQDFDTVTFKLKNRDTTSITSVRIVISVFNKTGQILSDTLHSVDVASGLTRTLTLYLGSVIANSEANKLYFAFQTSKLVSFTYMTLPSVGDNIIYGRTAYSTTSSSMSGVLSSWEDNYTPTDRAPWVTTRKRIQSEGMIANSSFIANSSLVSTTDPSWQLSFDQEVASLSNTYAVSPYRDIQYASSTFSGWGSYIGIPQNFNAIRFKIRGRSTNTESITRINCYVTEFDKSGAQLAYGEIDLDAAPGIETEVIWNIGFTIPNESQVQMYFIFQCNQLVDLYSSLSPVTLDGINYGRSSYSMNGSMVLPGSMNDSSNTSTIIWTEVGEALCYYAPSALFTQDLEDAQNSAAAISYDNATSGLTAENVQDAVDELSQYQGATYPRLILPDDITGVVGDTLQVFVRAIIEAQDPYHHPYELSCSVGKTMPRYFELTPSESQVGTQTLTASIQNLNGTDVKTDTVDIVVVNPTGQPSSNKNVLCVGDSLTDNKLWPGECYRRLTQSGGNPAGLEYGNISFIGTDLAPSYPTQKQTGRSGWTWASYTGDNAPKSYIINCSGHDKDITDYKSYYKDANQNTWWLEKIDTSTIKIIAFFHDVDLPATGTLVWYSGGTHNSSIVYTGSTLENATPFWDTSLNEFSFTAFMNDNGYTGQNIDILYVLLGWNGLPGQNKYLPSDHATTINTARTFLNKLHEQYPTAEARILGIQVPSITGGLGTNYGASGTYANYYKLLRTANGLNIGYQELCNESGIADFARFVSIAHQFDSEYNMPSSDVAVNTRNATTEGRGTNGVHPDIPGYMQIADAVYRDFIRSFCSS